MHVQTPAQAHPPTNFETIGYWQYIPHESFQWPNLVYVSWALFTSKYCCSKLPLLNDSVQWSVMPKHWDKITVKVVYLQQMKLNEAKSRVIVNRNDVNFAIYRVTYLCG